MFGCVHSNPKNVINLIFLIAKQYLYRCRCTKEKPEKLKVISCIEDCKKIEAYNAKLQGKTASHYKKWYGLKQNVQWPFEKDANQTEIELERVQEILINDTLRTG